MKNEIKIILEEGQSNKAKGNCFEGLVRNLLSVNQYKVRQNIRSTGMEIDLIGEHKHRSNEIVYVECKAKDKVSSVELRTFFANVYHNKANFGYFFRTNELEYDAGGLVEEYRSDDRYNNLTFFEPDDIIKMLKDGKFIYEPDAELSPFALSKRLLCVTYLGDFFIYLVNESTALPTKFIIVDANSNEKPISKEAKSMLVEKVSEIKGLEVIEDLLAYDLKKSDTIDLQMETISEVQESENWYDYLPASSENKHFVGRVEIRTKILSFFKNVRDGKTKKRIFYLNGKSGWGKSSLVLELKNRCRNKHYKNKFCAIAIDTRSATSDNFVALSLRKLIKESVKEGFVRRDIFFDEVQFTSNTDLFSSESVKKFFAKLEEENKFIVLIFDQFEDVFRKKNFFLTFYKFLSDVTDKKPNIIVGFSWKTDFYLQSGDPSYHIWQQAKEQAREFTITEFGEKEINGIIKQLENSIGELSNSVKNRILESSQGLPWLTKKLCIHIYDQIESGMDKKDLVESNLNILDLFEKDEEQLETDELKALNLIAKRASDGNFFDESEVGELINSETITSLLHKRFIIRSGANYNIYWDIYRDYLVTGKVPMIGESYLIRQGVNLCKEVFLLFTPGKKESSSSLLDKHSKDIGAETLNNILTELRNLGFVKKEGEYYYLHDGLLNNEDSFVSFITDKFQNYTPYIELEKLNLKRITKTDVIGVMKRIFKQDFQDNTWDAYAKNFISWIWISNLELKERLAAPRKGPQVLTISKKDIDELVLKSSLKEIFEIIPWLIIDSSSIGSRFFRDLFLLGLIDENKELTRFTRELFFEEDEMVKKKLKDKVLALKKMKELKEIIGDMDKVTAKEVIKVAPESFFDGEKESSKIIYAAKALTWLK